MSGKVVVYGGKGTGKVVFDGTVHANKGLTCVDCHPTPFQMKTGGDEINMKSMRINEQTQNLRRLSSRDKGI